MEPHPFVENLTKDWSPNRRKRFYAALNEAESEIAPSPSLTPIYRRPVPPAEIARLAPVGLRVFEELVEALRLSDAQRAALLGLSDGAPSPGADALTQDEFYRISYLVSIYINLAKAFGKDEAVRWLLSTWAEGTFAGHTAVTYLIDSGLPGFDRLLHATDSLAQSTG